tara:strand:- start:19504 stop:20511 length:1008 start_codon:yes stop_codon:yes gene_type:complete
MNLNGKSLLITGGTGSLGNALVEQIFKTSPSIDRLVIYSRDEQKQFQMAKKFPESEYPAIRYFIGDVRDYDRLERALYGINYVIHAAAMKHVPVAEYNPDECVKTNVIGAQNVINASLKIETIESVVALSTDKACSPINLYGATKLASDKLFVAANNIKGPTNKRFSVVRYGNVMGSNGSVMPFFLKEKEKKILPITDERMTRFNITLKEGVEMVLFALEKCMGGEILVPKIPSYNITDVAKAICKESEIKIIGIRPGEKLHEEMISFSDSFNTFYDDDYFFILPTKPMWSIEEFQSKLKTKKIEKPFSYSSDSNKDFLNVEQLRDLISSELLNE